MKKYAILSLFIFLSFCLHAQNRESRNLSSFNEISVGEAIEVTLVRGNAEKAEVEVTGTDAENVLTEVSGGSLKIHMASGNWRNVSARVKVTFKNIDEIDVTSAAKIYSDDIIKSADLEVTVSSAGYAELSIEAANLDLDVSSAGKLELEGSADNMEAKVSSAGTINAYDLKVRSAEISANSAGTIKTTVSESLEAKASGAGTIRYKGDPQRAIANSNGGGTIRKED